MIAANKVGAGLAFDQDENALTVYWPGGGKRELAFSSKLALARQLVEVIAERYGAAATKRTGAAKSPSPAHAS
jgi:phosphopantothenoylcysteine decarboxylase/phosphopantothenate--cysteine ligase